MSLKLIPTPEFAKNVKKLQKRFRLIYKDLENLQIELSNNPLSGINLGGNCYKLRLSNSSIPTGKSGGFRIIYFYLISQDLIYLLAIFSKSDLENISEDKIVELLKNNEFI
jgi:mRNA-degrading endonuclease RelE of RelBE toxin-antitoxin system